MKHQKDFYTAKEKLGLLSFGDPGSNDKLYVNDTYLVSFARKLDRKLKNHPDVKRRLLQVRGVVRKTKTRLKRSSRTATPPAVSSTEVFNTAAAIKNLSLPTSKQPIVSIIIPAFNKVHMSVACLQSLSKLSHDRVPFQVILIDNGSSDDTHLLKNIPGLTYVHNEENLGFVGGCNSGIQHVQGDFTVFLNNDAEVAEDWLFELYNTIVSDPTIGLVGSKIIYPNGLLQEAGGIIFKDGSGLNYGKFDRADSFQYNYVRDVDYCSGASIIVSTKLLKDFGGFDSLYQPAYYEDTDLAFKIRKAGLRVVYQPASVIYHIEGGTAGTNLNTGFKRFQEINKEKFLKRWSKVLQKNHVDADEYYSGRDRSGSKLALIIEESLPSPDKDSGSVRMMAIIKNLQELGYKVTFWPNDLKKVEPYASKMQKLGVEVVYGDIDFLQFAKHYAHFYDLVIMSRPEICARYINITKSLFTKAKLVYDTVDLHYVRLARQAEVEKSNSEALLEQSKWYRVLELGLMERADTTLVVSEKEIEILRDEGVKTPLSVVSNIHSIHEPAYEVSFSQRKNIVFVGNYAHLPNRDAIRWFIKDILPSIRKQLPSALVRVVGANMPSDLQKELAGEGVTIDGFVSNEELATILSTSRVFIAPLRYGAGVKGKIGQSIEFALPVVTTTIGAEGMHLINNESCLVADDADSFSSAVVRLYSDEKIWSTVQKNAKLSLEKHFSPQTALSALRKFL